MYNVDYVYIGKRYIIEKKVMLFLYVIILYINLLGLSFKEVVVK